MLYSNGPTEPPITGEPLKPLSIGRARSLCTLGGPLLQVDGPYAAPCTNIPSYKTVMLVSGGIGLTPFASALTALLCYKFRDAVNPAVKEAIRPRHVYFYWLFQMKDYVSFQWFARLLSNLRWRYLQERQSYLRYSQRGTPGDGGPSSFVEDISLQINLVVTRGDPTTTEAPGREPVRELAAAVAAAGGGASVSYASKTSGGDAKPSFTCTVQRINGLGGGGGSG